MLVCVTKEGIRIKLKRFCKEGTNEGLFKTNESGRVLPLETTKAMFY